jgi:uncharacterized protein YndB with AHSA1/START domain
VTDRPGVGRDRERREATVGDIRKSYVIDAPPETVWRALTDAGVMEEWGAGSASMDPRPGGLFSQWGGDIYGTVTEVAPGDRLVEEWYGGEWAEPSIAVFVLSEHGEGTLLDLTHTGVPDDQLAEFDAGWDDYYLGAIKEWAER